MVYLVILAILGQNQARWLITNVIKFNNDLNCSIVYGGPKLWYAERDFGEAQNPSMKMPLRK